MLVSSAFLRCLFFFPFLFDVCAGFCLTAVGFLQRLCIGSLYAHCALCLLLPFMTLPKASLLSWALKQSCPCFCPDYFLFVAAHYKELCSLCLKVWEMWQSTGALGALWQRWAVPGPVSCINQELHQLQQNVPLQGPQCEHVTFGPFHSFFPGKLDHRAIWNTMFYMPQKW